MLPIYLYIGAFMSDFDNNLWKQAGISRSTWYRYLSYHREEVAEKGYEWLVDKIIERKDIKKCLSDAHSRITMARLALRMHPSTDIKK